MRFILRPGLWMRAAYTFYYAGIACWGPYITLYYRQLGLSGFEIGLLAAIPPLAMAVLAPLWGMLADLWGIHRLVLRAALLFAAIATLLLSFATTFAPILLLVILLALFGAPVSPLLDSYAVTISARQGLSFGQLRLWGSIGYTVTAWIVGWIMGGAVTALFLAGYAVFLLLTGASTFGLPAQRLSARRQTWRGAAGVIRRPAMIVLLLTVFLVSSSTSSMFSFFGIYLQQLGGTAGLIGTASAVAALSELPVMAYGAWLAARLSSQRMFILALAVYAIRLVLYSLLPAASWVLPVQLLHGLSFGVYLMSSVELIQRLVGRELAATAQGLLSSALAFGQITGALVGGALLDRIGVSAIYRLGSVVMVIAIAVFVFGFRRFAPAGETHAGHVAEAGGQAGAAQVVETKG